MACPPGSVVAVCTYTSGRHRSTIRKVKSPSTHFRRIARTTTGAVSGTLQSIISLSNVSPQHSGAIRVGCPSEVKAKSSSCMGWKYLPSYFRVKQHLQTHSNIISNPQERYCFLFIPHFLMRPDLALLGTLIKTFLLETTKGVLQTFDGRRLIMSKGAHIMQ